VTISTAECMQNTMKFHNHYQRACEFLEQVIEALDRTQKSSMNISDRTAVK
jgi:aminopeptidase C